MRPFVRLVAVTVLAAVPVLPALHAEECTTAVVSPAAAIDARPVLWKNRDTGTLSNKVVFVDAEPFDYLCLANANAASGRSCFAGLNAAGFAIMNSVAYNLPETPGETADLEGLIMADALRSCRTAEDFGRYLDRNLGPGLGSLANFGVIDADGAALLFETHNHGVTVVDAASAATGYVVNTNFARSGAAGAGQGYLRYERASDLFRSFSAGAVDAAVILDRFTRDIGHVLLDHPSLSDLATIPAGAPRWISCRDCIDRPDTAAAVVIVGRDPGDTTSMATMWVIPGEPLTAVAIPLWVEAGESPECLWRGDHAAMWLASRRIKDRILRPLHEGHKRDYLRVDRLDNASGTGFLPLLRTTQAAIRARTEAFLRRPHSPAELAEFQRGAADQALAVLTAIE